MTGRLFWKIFIAFFLAFIAQVAAMFVLLQVFYPATPKVELSDYRALQEDVLALRSALDSGGFRDLDKRLFGKESGPFSIREIQESTPVDAAPKDGRIVTSRSGARYLIEFNSPVPRGRAMDIPTAQIYVNTVGLVLGLIFAAGLALYLSRPIRSLRRGLEAFAAGDLRVRLGDSIGGRRDEIADLARDFDKMADRVEELVRARERLINDVSHELRSPLARLRLAIALARQRPERTAAALERVENEVGRLDEIVGELLTLSRLESGVDDHQGYFDLSELLRKLIADASFESGSTQVKFESVVGDEVSPNSSIRGDAELIRRAVENIVRNAIRFSPANGTIAISVLQRSDEARIQIEDEGPGVAENELRTLFEPFVKGSGGGFGLGLAIAKRAVLAHAGSIVAENRSPTGLRVTIRLPTCFPLQRMGAC
jgi:two-component system OmpR family sensor kinase